MKHPSLVVYFGIQFAWILIGPGILGFLLFALLNGGEDLARSASQAFGAAALGGLMYAAVMTVIKGIDRRSELRKKEPNQPLQRNASTGSVSNFKSPARRG